MGNWDYNPYNLQWGMIATTFVTPPPKNKN